MAKSLSLQARLSAVMEMLTAAAVRQMCEMVDGDVVCLRRELERARSEKAALSEQLHTLQGEVEELRAAQHQPAKSQRSVYIQTLEDPPSINGIYGKEWCCNLWDKKGPNTEDAAIYVDCVVSEEPKNQDHGKLLTVKEENDEKEICPDNSTKTTTSSRRKERSKKSNIVEVNLVDEDDDDLYYMSTGFSETPGVRTVTSGSPCKDSTKLISVDGTVEHVIMPTGERMVYNEHCMPVEFFEDCQYEDGDAASSQNLFMGLEDISTSDSGQVFNYLDRFNERYHFEPGEHFVKAKHSCSVCNKTFMRQSRLVLHVQKCHQKLNSNRCHSCNVVFPQKNLLRTHKCLPSEKQSRTCNLKFTCEQCGKQFHSRANLKVHYTVHTGERPHRCSYCGKGFSQKGNLNTHERIHKGERPFVCVTCGKAFTQKVNLSQHLTVHTKMRMSKMHKTQ